MDERNELQDLMDLLTEIGLPFAYDHFAEGESPDPPFITFLIPGSENPETERLVEDVLDAHDIFYEKTEVWIESERLYEVLYSFEREVTEYAYEEE